MHRTYNKFLIVSALILIIGSIYIYFSNNLDVQAVSTPVSSDSSVSSQNGSSPASLLSTDNKIAVDTAFLSTLTSLKKIKIDISIFSNPGFQALNDNTVNLEAITPGRPNPFAPIQSISPTDTTSAPSVVTNEPTQVTAKSAVLNGTINGLTGITSIYFEYGTDPELNKSTPPVKQSLIGTFVANITGLTSETTYFVRAVAKVGNAPIYGEVVSFNTN